METLSKNKIKWIRSLQMKKNRDLEKLFVVEGEKMVTELIKKWPEKLSLLCTQSDLPQFKGDSYFTDDKAMREISSLATPSKFLAVVYKPIYDDREDNFVLAIDGVQDPGNMGTILRTADWFKVDKIVCSMNSVDIFNPKVVQSSMGSIFNTPVVYVELSDYLSNIDLPVYGALLEGENIYGQSLTRNGVIVVGNEGNGISEEIKALVEHPIHIPRFGEAESLNVSIATGIILSEFSRQH